MVDAAALAMIVGGFGCVALVVLVRRPSDVETVVRTIRSDRGLAMCLRLAARRIGILPDDVVGKRRVAQSLATRRFAVVRVGGLAVVVIETAVAVTGIVACVEVVRALGTVVVRRALLTIPFVAVIPATVPATVPGAIAAFTPATATTLLPLTRALVSLGFCGGFRLRFFLLQEFAIRDRDLIIVRMDFVEGEEAVTIAAVLDKSRLERRLDPRNLCQVDVAAK